VLLRHCVIVSVIVSPLTDVEKQSFGEKT